MKKSVKNDVKSVENNAVLRCVVENGYYNIYLEEVNGRKIHTRLRPILPNRKLEYLIYCAVNGDKK